MIRYLNLGGDSGVAAYANNEGLIEVQFSDGWIYRYTNQSAGKMVIDEMKRLAIAGRGLNSYIGRVVKKRYESKRR